MEHAYLILIDYFSPTDTFESLHILQTTGPKGKNYYSNIFYSLYAQVFWKTQGKCSVLHCDVEYVKK